MKTVSLVILLLVTHFVCYPFTPKAHYCLTNHLLDAIKINQFRLPLYKKRTNDFSTIPISLGLITMEVSMLPALFYLDIKAKKFHKKGIPLFCNEVVSMQKTPPFLTSNSSSRKDGPKSKENIVYQDTHHYFKKEILARLKEKNNFGAPFWDRLETTLRREIKNLNTHFDIEGTQHNCLYRHILESMVRTAHFASSYETLNLSYTEHQELAKLSQQFFRLHLYAFGISHYFDKLAYPIQQKGTPIICNDVPPLLFDF